MSKDPSSGGEGRPAKTIRGTGPAARARAEGRDYNVELLKSAYTPLTDESGVAKSKIQPYLPILDTCTLCPARCCRLNVKVPLPDAVEYCRVLGVPFFAGLTLAASSHEAHAFKVTDAEWLLGDAPTWDGRAELQLRRKEDGSCHGLIQVGGYDRCGVYAARPTLCRLYPMAWTSDVARGGPEMVLCPVPYAVTPAAERQFIRDIERSIERWELHDDIVAEWHAERPDGGTIEDFVRFAVPRTMEAMEWTGGDFILDTRWPENRLMDAMVEAKVTKPSQPLMAPTRSVFGAPESRGLGARTGNREPGTEDDTE